MPDLRHPRVRRCRPRLRPDRQSVHRQRSLRDAPAYPGWCGRYHHRQPRRAFNSAGGRGGDPALTPRASSRCCVVRPRLSGALRRAQPTAPQPVRLSSRITGPLAAPSPHARVTGASCTVSTIRVQLVPVGVRDGHCAILAAGGRGNPKGVRSSRKNTTSYRALPRPARVRAWRLISAHSGWCRAPRCWFTPR